MVVKTSTLDMRPDVRELLARGEAGEHVELVVDGVAVTVTADYCRAMLTVLEPVDDQRMLTTGQVADELSVSRPTVVAWIDRGDLVAHRIGTHRRVKVGELNAFIARRREAQLAAFAELTEVSADLGLYD